MLRRVKHDSFEHGLVGVATQAKRRPKCLDPILLVEDNVDSANFLHARVFCSSMDHIKAWVLSSSLNPTRGGECGAPEATVPVEKDIGSACDSACRSSTSTDSGITSGLEQDSQLLTLEESDNEECGPSSPQGRTDGSSNLEEETLPAVSAVDPRTCAAHPGSYLSLYCVSCGTSTCRECCKGHTGHVCWRMEDFLLQQKQVVHRMTAKLQGRLQQCRKASEGREAYKTELLAKKCLLQKTLTERGQYYHYLVDRWLAKTAVELETTCAHELQMIGEGKSRADDISQRMLDVCEKAVKLVGQETVLDPDDVIASGRSLTTETLHLSDESFPEVPQPLCFILSRGSTIDLEALGTFSASRLDRNHTGTETQHTEGRLLTLPSRSGPFAVSRPRHLRSFESREVHKVSDYMATGLSVTGEGHPLVSDVGVDSVKEFDAMGRSKTCFITLPEDHPTKAVQLQNKIVAVACKNDVKLFIPGGEFWKKLGHELYSPQSVSLDPEGNLVVCDVTKHGASVVRFYDKENIAHLRTVELYPSEMPEPDLISSNALKKSNKHNPWYVCVTNKSDILVTDALEHTVKAFAKDGKQLWTAGGKGAGPSHFFTPAGLCVDPFGHVLVADCGNDRVHMLTPTGEFLTVILSEEDGVERPTDVAVDKDGHVWVVQGDGQVKCFQYLF